jgi:signal transduction histidine kinase
VAPADYIPLNRTSVDLPALLEGAVETLREQARFVDVSLSIEASPDFPRVRVDAEKIAWAVATLVGNALRTVRHRSRHRPGGSVRVRIRTEPGGVVVAIEDDGPGIPPDKVASLFRRGAGVTLGTDLALLLIQDVIVAHGGTVDVRSSTEAFASGTKVSLRIPTEQHPAAP